MTRELRCFQPPVPEEASKDVAEAVEAEVITLRCSNAAFDVSDARFNSVQRLKILSNVSNKVSWSPDSRADSEKTTSAGPR